jgi:NSS family neurotransmitter:Na+ symporter
MGNIWMFPMRVSKYGGATFLIPYFIFLFLIAASGVIEEMSFGRSTRKGPIGSFADTLSKRFGKPKLGAALGILPVVGSLAMAIGYSVVVGWIVAYTFGAFSGSTMANDDISQFAAAFGSMATLGGNNFWQIIGMIIIGLILALGIGNGIEKANKVMIPLFYVMFIGLAIYVSTLPGASAGYQYIFVLDPQGLLDPMVWVFALGQAFFSLSIAGSGTLIYGSYLDKRENIPFSAKMVAIFSAIAAMLAALVIIPAIATTGEQLSSGGPGLLFIYLPNIIKGMPGGQLILIIFFVAVLFAGLTSLINLFETPVATLQELLHLKRSAAVAIIMVIGVAIGLCIQGIVAGWMDFCSIVACPIGAALAGIMFFWFHSKKDCLKEVNRGRTHPLGAWFYPLGKYVFCGVTILIFIVGCIIGGM